VRAEAVAAGHGARGTRDAEETGRRYAGRSPHERRQQRRQQLLDAGLQVFGTVGYDEATITLLCATARVGTKAFYEEFPSREALLLAVATDVVAAAAQHLEAALADAPKDLELRVRAGLTAYIGYLTEDPRRARIAYHEVRVAPLEAERQFASVAFASLVTEQVAQLGVGGHARDNLLLALAITGGVGELLNYWTSAAEKPTTERLVDELTRLFVAALR
jgi:AcrR family transcriptional regulator